MFHIRKLNSAGISKKLLLLRPNQIRNFASDSHDDFKPKRKIISDGIIIIIYYNCCYHYYCYLKKKKIYIVIHRYYYYYHCCC